MLRNKIISIVALAVIGLASPTGAFARGGHGGGGFHGGRRFSRRWRIWISRRRISRTRVRLFRAVRLR
jgi:hypothetical protein